MDSKERKIVGDLSKERELQNRGEDHLRWLSIQILKETRRYPIPMGVNQEISEKLL